MIGDMKLMGITSIPIDLKPPPALSEPEFGGRSLLNSVDAEKNETHSFSVQSVGRWRCWSVASKWSISVEWLFSWQVHYAAEDGRSRYGFIVQRAEPWEMTLFSTRMGPHIWKPPKLYKPKGFVPEQSPIEPF